MTQWHTQRSWSKAWTYVLLALIAVFTSESGSTWLGDGSSNHKRVFSPGFIVICVFVIVVELMVLNHFYGERR